MFGPTISLHIIVAGPRRSWTREEKRAILDEVQSTTASISSLARRHGLTPSLLFCWRCEAWDEEWAAALLVPPPFLPLALPAPVGLPTRDQGAPGGAIDVELADGHRLRAEAGADPALVRNLLAALLDRRSPFPSGLHAWLATGHTDMRKGFDGLAALVQDHLHHDPFSGQAFAFRDRAGRLIKVLWWEGQGLCLFSKRLERGLLSGRGLQGPRLRLRRFSSRCC